LLPDTQAGSGAWTRDNTAGAQPATFELKRNIQLPRSSLEPAGGLPLVTDTDLPERQAAMPERLQMIVVGHRQRPTTLFTGFSEAEATILGTFMEHC
jgi:hypothetical protein